VSGTIRPASADVEPHPAPLPAASGQPAGVGPSFARALRRIGAADPSPGNRVRLFADGNTTFDAMIALIGAAKNSVALESYILRDDGVGKASRRR
jgi:phosphatidylserine/phosphatidylglycerophosphate/cardiolipin synthase-like enzyme